MNAPKYVFLAELKVFIQPADHVAEKKAKKRKKVGRTVRKKKTNK